MFHLICKFIVIFSLLNIVYLKEFKNDKKLDYFFDKLERVSMNDEKIFAETVDVKKEGNTKFFVSAELEQFIELDDSYKIGITVNYANSSTPDSYETLVASPQIGLCEFMKTYYTFLYHKLKQNSQIPPPETCPLAPQKYILTDAPINFKMLYLTIDPGFYRIDIDLYKADEKKGGYQIFGHVVKV